MEVVIREKRKQEATALSSRENVGGSEKSLVFCRRLEVLVVNGLAAESVQGASLTFQSVDDIHGGDGLALGMLGVGDGITDDVLEEDLENSAGLLVDEAGDTLDTTTAGQTTDSGLGDTLDVITQDFPVTLGATLSESLSSFATARHVSLSVVSERNDSEPCARPAYIQAGPARLTASAVFRRATR